MSTIEARREASKRQNDRRKARKLEAIERLGRACNDCGVTYPPEIYDFHHINPEDKTDHPGRVFNRVDWWEEISKCALLCANCHRLRHLEEDK